MYDVIVAGAGSVDIGLKIQTSNKVNVPMMMYAASPVSFVTFRTTRQAAGRQNSSGTHHERTVATLRSELCLPGQNRSGWRRHVRKAIKVTGYLNDCYDNDKSRN